MKSSLDIPECVFLVYGPFRAGIEDLFFYLYLIGHLSISNNSSLLFQVTDYPYYPESGTSVKYDGQKSKVYSGMSKNCCMSECGFSANVNLSCQSVNSFLTFLTMQR